MDIFDYPNLPRDIKCELAKELTLSEIKTLRLTSKQNKDIIRDCLIHLFYDDNEVETNISAELIIKLPAVQVVDQEYSININNPLQTEAVAKHPKLREMHIRFDNRSFRLVNYLNIFFTNYDLTKDYNLKITDYHNEVNFIIQSNNDSVYLDFSSMGILRQAEILHELNKLGLNIETLQLIFSEINIKQIKQIPSLRALIIANQKLNWKLIESLLLDTRGSSIDTITINPDSYNERIIDALAEYFSRFHILNYPKLKRFLPLPISIYEFDENMIQRVFPSLEIADIDVTNSSNLSIGTVTEKLNRKGKAYRFWYH